MGPKNAYVLTPFALSSSRAWSFSSTVEDWGSNCFLMLSFRLVMVKPILRSWNFLMRSRSLRTRADLVCMVMGYWCFKRISSSFLVSSYFCSRGW